MEPWLIALIVSLIVIFILLVIIMVLVVSTSKCAKSWAPNFVSRVEGTHPILVVVKGLEPRNFDISYLALAQTLS